MAAMDSLSTYDSIISDEEGDQWVKLRETNVLARLRRKFWGVCMQDEETRWRATHPENELMDVDVDVDETAEEDEGDETGAGCFILTLGAPGCSELWIRKDYIRLYDYCQKYLESHRNKQVAPALVITGQPGVGKSFWVFYALRRCLAEKKPVIWYHESAPFLFVEDGVYKAREHFGPTTHKTLVWTLVDSDESPSGVPSRLTVKGTQHFIIFNTSPQPMRWKHMEKSTNWAICVMNPWTRKEISKAAVMHGFTDSDDDRRISEMYEQFGPTPRICFDLLSNRSRLIAYKIRCSDALEGLSFEKLRKWVSEAKKFSMDSASHTVVLLKRVSRKELKQSNLDDGDDVYLNYSCVEPLTSAVRDVLRVKLREQSRADQLQLYEHLASVEGTRCIAGLAFEALGHSKLRNKIVLKLVPMVKRESGGSDQGRKLPQWHSDHGDGANPSSVRQIDFTPVRTCIYSSYPHQIEDEVYYVLKARNQVAFDSFIMADQNLYIFQFTIGSNHPIKKGIVDFFLQESLPPRANWHFVFVAPTGSRSEISCPQSRDSGLKELMEEMKLFSAVLDPE